MYFSPLLSGFPSAQLGHYHIGQKHINGMLTRPPDFERANSGVRHQDPVAEFPENRLCERAYACIILHQKDRFQSDGHRGTSGRASLFVIARSNGEIDPETAALARFA